MLCSNAVSFGDAILAAVNAMRVVVHPLFEHTPRHDADTKRYTNTTGHHSPEWTDEARTYVLGQYNHVVDSIRAGHQR